jgi:hypothetical protein
MNDLSIIISVLFVIVTLLTAWQFYNASGKSKTVLAFISAWLILQALIGLTGFYQNTQSFPPRFILLIGPGIILSVLILVSKRNRNFIDSFSLRKLTLLHTVRIPVEITLFFVYTAKLVPLIMTFEGNNYDIISGLTAPVIYYLFFIKKKIANTVLLAWNFICLGFLINILVIAVLAAPTPFQQLAFDQPNIGVTFFPFVWLPGFVVPIVLVSHFIAIRQLVKNRDHAASIKNIVHSI